MGGMEGTRGLENARKPPSQARVFGRLPHGSATDMIQLDGDDEDDGYILITLAAVTHGLASELLLNGQPAGLLACCLGG